ncbi:zinc transport system substrate-binding protein [Alteribacillus persepolensis]|uniref:Zinc transport system substrate-binding protein n=1 Tax=Alteribacillus persepolensis TaxID=568899 RepID=A0A1G8GTY3_9BACI|nr:zinc ABC transporter substrate-binding protein [Alteribacillus persepolensis]SDH97773.1 zinc transport system substrate-binding protein [Alteribacillus persepolensis]
MIKKCWLMAVVLLCAVTAIGCAAEESVEEAGGEEVNNGEDAPLHIYTTLFVWEDFTKKIGGDEVQVQNIVPAGGDPHTFEPTAQTMIDIAEADAFIFNGGGMEGFAEQINAAVQEEGVTSVEVTKGMELRQLNDDHAHSHGHNDHAHEHGEADPHVWLDPILAMEAVDYIKEALIEMRPEKEDVFHENAKMLQRELQEVDERFSDIAASSESNQFVVSHAAYGYWEDRYGLEQIGITGLSPSDEPSQKELQAIIDMIEEQEVEYVMFERNISSKVTEVVQDESGTQALHLHNLESVSEEEREAGKDYLQIMEENIKNLQQALSYEGNHENNHDHQYDEHEHDHHN